MTSRLASIRALLARYGPLQHWLEEIRAQTGLLDHISSRLTAATREHCISARIDGDTLYVFADSSAWATRLRYELPRILPELKVRKIHVRVAPPLENRPASSREKPHLSPATAELLERTADSMTDPDLKAALRRLAAHGQAAGNAPAD